MIVKSRRARAVDLLMGNPPAKVAESVGVRLSTLEGWMRTDSFREALRSREAEQKRSLSRIARQVAVNAAEALCQVAAGESKADGKLLLDVLKASGAFEAEAEDPAALMEEILWKARMEADTED